MVVLANCEKFGRNVLYDGNSYFLVKKHGNIVEKLPSENYSCSVHTFQKAATHTHNKGTISRNSDRYEDSTYASRVVFLPVRRSSVTERAIGRNPFYPCTVNFATHVRVCQVTTRGKELENGLPTLWDEYETIRISRIKRTRLGKGQYDSTFIDYDGVIWHIENASTTDTTLKIWSERKTASGNVVKDTRWGYEPGCEKTSRQRNH